MPERERARLTRDELLAKVLALPAADREFILERIDENLASDPTVDRGGFAAPELAGAWAAEVQRRIEMIDKGLVRPLPADAALREAHALLAKRTTGRAAS